MNLCCCNLVATIGKERLLEWANRGVCQVLNLSWSSKKLTLHALWDIVFTTLQTRQLLFSWLWTKNKQKLLHSSRTVAILWPAWTSWSPRRVDISQLCSYEDNKPFWFHLVFCYKFTSRKDDPLHLMTVKTKQNEGTGFLVSRVQRRV